MSGGAKSQPNHHPTDDQLFAYAEKRLPSDLRSVLREHLNVCRQCKLRLDEIHSELAIHTSDSSSSVNSTKFQKGSLPPELPGVELKHPEYVVIRELARGGMGIVFLVEHRLTKRQEVIKIIRPSYVDRLDVRQRFLQEIQTAAQLDHPCVVKTYSAFENGNTLGLVLEYVPGVSLSHHVQKHGPLNILQSIEMLHQATAGLQHAHSLGMVHRDIKPSNLMIHFDGPNLRLKLLDFGLAKSSSELSVSNDERVKSGLIGTPNYMAPEQAKNPIQADIRADLYSLGCTLFFALVGRPPCDGKNAKEVIEKHRRGELHSLEEFRKDAPPALISLYRKLTATAISDRFQDPTELLQQIERIRDEILGLSESISRPLSNPPASSIPAPVESKKKSRTVEAEYELHLPESTKKSVKKSKTRSTKPNKQSKSAVPSVVAAFVPVLVIGIALTIKPLQEWNRLIRETIGFPIQDDSAIVLEGVPNSIEVLINGYPAKFSRPRADQPPEIQAKPGEYELSYRINNNISEPKKFTLAANQRLSLKYEGPPIDSKPANVREAITAPPKRTEVKEAPATADNSKTALDDPKVEKLIESAIQSIKIADEQNFVKSIDALKSLPETHPRRNELNAIIKVRSWMSLYRDQVRRSLVTLSAGDPILLRRDDRSVASTLVSKSLDTVVINVQGTEQRFAVSNLPVTLIDALARMALKESPDSIPMRSIAILLSDRTSESDKDDALNQLVSSSATAGVDFVPIMSRLRSASEPVSIAEQSRFASSESTLFQNKHSFRGHDGPVHRMQFLIDGRLASAQQSSKNGAPIDIKSPRGTIKVWNVQKGEAVDVKTTYASIHELNVSNNRKMIAVFGAIKADVFELNVLTDVNSKVVLKSSEIPSGNASLFFSDDNRGLLAVDSKGYCLRFNLKEGKLIKKTEIKASKSDATIVRSVASRDLGSLFTLYSNGEVRVWKTMTGADPDAKPLQEIIPNLGVNKVLCLWSDPSFTQVSLLDALGVIHTVECDSLKQSSETPSNFGRVQLGSAMRLKSGDTKVIMVDLNHIGLYSENEHAMQDHWNQGTSSSKEVASSLQQKVVAITSVDWDENGKYLAIGMSDGSIQLLEGKKE